MFTINYLEISLMCEISYILIAFDGIVISTINVNRLFYYVLNKLLIYYVLSYNKLYLNNLKQICFKLFYIKLLYTFFS